MTTSPTHQFKSKSPSVKVPSPYLTVMEVGNLMRCGPRFILKLIHSEDPNEHLPSYPLGRRYRIHFDDLRQWLLARRMGMLERDTEGNVIIK
jgi:excisionase family DNA binding protein